MASCISFHSHNLSRTKEPCSCFLTILNPTRPGLLPSALRAVRWRVDRRGNQSFAALEKFFRWTMRCSQLGIRTPPANHDSELAVVVITRNEALNIGVCLESVVRALVPFPGTPVVVVDSDSTDETVSIALGYPVTVYRYRAGKFTAAAGRRIGFENVSSRYVLFVDGDCCLDPGWLKAALPLIRTNPDVAVVHGAREEVILGTYPAPKRAAVDAYGLGGNGLFRSAVLHKVGTFNPYLVSWEEGELLGRIQAAGYRAKRTSAIMFTHRVKHKDNLESLLRRYRRRMFGGPGQVLRVSFRQGLFAYHVRRFNRYLYTLGYLVIGAILLLIGAIFGWQFPQFGWIGAGVAAFAWLWFRRRSLGSAVYIVAEWFMIAVAMPGGFAMNPPAPEAFRPQVEQVSP